MDCGRMLDQLSSYIDGALPKREHMEVEKHLAECAECRAELVALKLLVHSAGEIEAVEPPAGLRMSIAAATTAKPKMEHGWTVARLRLQRILSARSLRWAGGIACAAVAMVVFVGLGHINEPTNRTALRAKSPAPISTSVTAVRPEPVRTALGAPPVSELHEATAHARVRSATPSSKPAGVASAVAHAPKPKLVAKARPGEERVADRAPANESRDSDALAVDDTTAAQTVAAVDIQEPAPEITDNASKQDRPALAKVASSPSINKDSAEEWFKKMKTEAAMHRRGRSSDVVAVINARF
jgi:hypothetical protein